jgi:hypothetical protein
VTITDAFDLATLVVLRALLLLAAILFGIGLVLRAYAWVLRAQGRAARLRRRSRRRPMLPADGRGAG